jgi:protoporphyrinogen oxidase
MKPVAIIGGGMTGLTAAFYLKQRGVPVRLFEAAPAWAA